MKKLIYLITLITVFVQSQNWSNLNGLPDAARYDDVYFFDTQLGWTANSAGEIYKTIDGGDTWTEVYNSSSYFRTIEFLDEQIGVAGTLDGKVLRTDDGGDTWTEIQDQIPELIDGICGFSHIGDTIYGVGIWSNPGYLIKSTDKGITWTYKDMSAYADGLVECHFIDENTGFAGGILESNGGVLLKTTDGGDTWETLHNTKGGNEYIWKIDFVTDLIAYASIESFTNSTYFLKTIDGGNNWEKLFASDEILDIEGIGFINENKGWLCPRNSPMLETINGGETWVALTEYNNINRYFRVNSGLMYASGSNLYKYTDDTVSISDVTYPKEHAFLNISPIPFDDKLEIKIKIDFSTNTRLDLFDINGKKVIEIHRGRLQEGIYDFNLDASKVAQLKKGTYVLLLRTNHRFISKRIIKK